MSGAGLGHPEIEGEPGQPEYSEVEGVLNKRVKGGTRSESDIRYKVLWIGEIGKHKGIGETKVLRNFFKNF